MHWLSKSIAVASLIALILTSLPVPVFSAVPGGRITFVNGVPGKRIDICIGGQEIRSGLPYGGKSTRKLGAGTKKLRVFVRHPGTCRGVKLAQRMFPLDPSGQLTLVITKNAPRVVPFDDSGLGFATAADDVAFAWRHAADLGNATWHFLADGASTINPTADPVFTKGDEATLTALLAQPSIVATAYATRPDKSVPFAGPLGAYISSGMRVQWILVGTSVANARIVVVKDKVSFIS